MRMNLRIFCWVLYHLREFSSGKGRFNYLKVLDFESNSCSYAMKGCDKNGECSKIYRDFNLDVFNEEKKKKIIFEYIKHMGEI